MDEKINLKFRKVITSQGWLKKSEYYTFGFTKEQIEEGKKRTWENPLVIFEKGIDPIALYFENGKLRIKYFASYYGFIEGLGEHKFGGKFDNGVTCSCGKVFFDKKRKKGIAYFEEHKKHMERLKNE
jgi:hypothetical protein